MEEQDNGYVFKKLTEEDLRKLEFMKSYFSYMIGKDEEVILMDRTVMDKEDIPVLIAIHRDVETRKVKRTRMATVEDVNQVVIFVQDKLDECFTHAIDTFIKGHLPSPGTN
jgi:hypothetical protein